MSARSAASLADRVHVPNSAAVVSCANYCPSADWPRAGRATGALGAERSEIAPVPAGMRPDSGRTRGRRGPNKRKHGPLGPQVKDGSSHRPISAASESEHGSREEQAPFDTGPNLPARGGRGLADPRANTNRSRPPDG